jgi:hypothetical protein
MSRSSPDYSFRQSLAYSQVLAAHRGAAAEFVRIGDDEPLGFASVRVKRLPVPGAGLALISFGPLLADGIESLAGRAVLRGTLSALAREYVDGRKLALRIAPPLALGDAAAEVHAAFRDCGFEIAAHAARYRTMIVDLDRPIEAIRKSLEQKWRNQLNNAERRGLMIDFATGTQAIARFTPLFEELRLRKDFHVELDDAFFDRVQRVAAEGDRLTVAIAREGESDVAGAVVDLSGRTAVYVLGATTEAGMRCKAAYALHWSIMMAARDVGCRRYDLGGIDPAENPGVHHFKVGFGGEDATAPGPFERRPRGLPGAISNVIEQIHDARRRWRSSKNRPAPAAGSGEPVKA